MIVALIDNGSLEPAAHRNLRALAAALTARAGIPVHALSWKHSDRISADALDGVRAATLHSWLTEHYRRGERDFVFIPFFVSAQGAIGSYLRQDVEKLQRELGTFRFAFTAGLAAQGVLVRIVAARIREAIRRDKLERPPVIVVDHGGPSPTSAALRNQVAAAVQRELGSEIGPVQAASMEGAAHAHNQPLFTDALTLPEFDSGEVVIAALFLAPGRHAGPHGDLAEIALAAEDRLAVAPLRCHFTASIGTHPDVVPALADALTHTVSTFHVAA